MRYLLLLFLAFLDVVIVYFMCYGLIDEKFRFSLKNKIETLQTIQTYGMGIIATLALGSIFYFLGGHVHRVLAVFICIGLIKFISKTTWTKAVSIYVMYFTAVIFLQILLTIPFYFFDLEQSIMFISGQIVTVVIIAYIYFATRTRLSKIFWFIELNLAFKFGVFALTLILIVSLFIINFEYTISHILYFFILIGAVLIALFQVMLRVNRKQKFERQQKYINELEAQYSAISSFKHDYTNILLSLSGYIMNEDLDGLEKYFKEKIVPTGDALKKNANNVEGLANLNIQTLKGLILVKLNYASLSNIKVIVDIPFLVNEINVDEISLSRIMGIIIDNAIEESIECEDALIEIGVVKKADKCIIVVTNTCRPKLANMQQLMKKGYTTKGNGNSGLGLSNLNKLIDRIEDASLSTEMKDGKFAQIIVITNS